MSNKSQSTAIGGFVLGALVLLVGAVLFFAKKRFNEEEYEYVMFFENSLSGLDVGAPVVYKGVKIGAVRNIEVISDNSTSTIYTPVFVEIYPKNFKQTNKIDNEGVVSLTKRMVDRGFRATLDTQSLLTGKMSIALELRPEVEPKYHSVINDVTEFPTAPSTLSVLASEFSNLPLSEIAYNLNRVLNNLNSTLEQLDLNSSLQTLDKTLVRYENLAQTIDQQVAPIAKDVSLTLASYRNFADGLNSELPKVSHNLQQSFQQIELMLSEIKNTAASIDESYGNRSETQYQLQQTLQELAKAAHSLRTLTEYLERHPEAIIYGKDKE